MKVLLIHNKYQQAGGEDLVFNMEFDLLREHGHAVEKLIFDNSHIKGWASKIAIGLSIGYNLQSARILEEKLKEGKPDVIHIHNFFPIASPSILFTSRKFNIPVVVTLHNFRLICPSAVLLYNGKIYERSLQTWFSIDAIRKGVYRNSIIDTAAVAMMYSFHNLAGTWKSKVDRFIILTKFARVKFKESKVRIRDSQFIIKPNFAHDFGISNFRREDFYLYVGRLSEEKGIDTALESAASFGFNLTIVGDGPLRNKVKSFVKNYPNIHWLGFQTKESVIHLLKRCKALLIPSVCYEGFPLSVLEAFSTGTPIIASRLGSLEEIILDKVNGLHFIAGDKYDLYKKIQLLESGSINYEELSFHARDTYLKHYTPEKNYELLIDIYRSVLKEYTVSDTTVLNLI